MLYHTYNTEGFVLGGFPVGEASRYVYVFTKDIGLVGVHAQSTRAIHSKLRYALNDLSYSSLSLVRGKHSWKLTNAAPQKNFFTLFRGDESKLVLTARILSLLKKLVPGEEKNPDLFEVIHKGIVYLESVNVTEEELKNIEALIMLRMVSILGYVGSEQEFMVFLHSNEVNKTLIEGMRTVRKSAVIAINKALKESGLS